MEYRSVLEFDEFWVDELVFRKNNDFQPAGRLRVENSFRVGYQPVSEGKTSLVSITCQLFSEDFELNQAPFFLRMKLTGRFFVEREEEAEAIGVKVDDILAANTVAILFPYVRSAITTVTAAMGVPPIILPPINTFKLLEQSEPDLQE